MQGLAKSLEELKRVNLETWSAHENPVHTESN